MALPDDLSLRAASPDDLPAIAALRASAGWAAHEWALRAAMTPPHALFLAVTNRGGSLAGIGSGISYGALGYVGNMVVAEPYRRRGVGSAILDEVLSFLSAHGATRFELYATHEGRPLYARRGFGLSDPSAMAKVPRDRLGGGERGAAATERVHAAGLDALEELVAYDAPRFGGDRRPLLHMMLTDAARPLLVATDGEGRILGYTWVRGDGARLGPFLADEPAVAESLLAEAFRRLPDTSELTINIPTGNLAGTGWLSGLGVALDPWDGRMARGTPPQGREERIYSNLVGALG